MNHLSKNYVSSDGHAYKSHSWELREGGYRRAALLVGNGIWPTAREKRLISFLLDRGFYVFSLELAFGSSQPPVPKLGHFRDSLRSFAGDAPPPGLPLYIVASSLSASALLPVASTLQDAAALALISPIVEFPPHGLKKSPFFVAAATISIAKDEESGMPELLKDLAGEAATLRLAKRDLKALSAELSQALSGPLGLPTAAFAGEDDPFLTEAGRKSLAGAGAKVYSYPRVRREPAHDRYADNFFADLGSFLDQVESGKATASAAD
jgi:hypothetical protein